MPLFTTDLSGGSDKTQGRRKSIPPVIVKDRTGLQNYYIFTKVFRLTTQNNFSDANKESSTYLSAFLTLLGINFDAEVALTNLLRLSSELSHVLCDFSIVDNLFKLERQAQCISIFSIYVKPRTK